MMDRHTLYAYAEPSLRGYRAPNARIIRESNAAVQRRNRWARTYGHRARLPYPINNGPRQAPEGRG